MKSIKGLTLIAITSRKNIDVLMFEVSWTLEGKVVRTTEEREACMKYLFLFTITMHDRTITVLYTDTIGY